MNQQTTPIDKPLAPISWETAFFHLIHDTIKIFSSVQLAIILIASLAVGVMVGVFMPQEGLTDAFQIKKQFGEWYLFCKALGLFNVYSSYWFLTLEILFFFNLFIGSFRWLKPAIMAATHKQVLEPAILAKAKMHVAWQMHGVSQAQAETILAQAQRQFHYRTINQSQTEKTIARYTAKGRWTRFGPAVAHIGILSMLMASVFGSFTGFKAQKVAVPGETFHVTQANTFTTNMPAQFWQGRIPAWKLKVTDFKVELYTDRPDTVKQYYCTLQVLGPKNRIFKQETISVNHPLQVGDVMVYQASYAPTGKLFLTINGQNKTVRTNDKMQDRPVAWVPINDHRSLMLFPFFVQQDPGIRENYLVAFMRDHGKFVGQAPGKMPHNLKLKPGQTGQLDGIRLTYQRPELATGLQIKSAPETAWIYLSFLLICLGTAMCFFSQRQLWWTIEETTQGVLLRILTKTNKGKIGFQQELQQLANWLKQHGAIVILNKTF